MALVDEIKSDKRKSIFKKIFFLFLFVWISYFGYNYVFIPKEIINTNETKKFTVKKDDLKVYIESDGKVSLKDEFSLDFQNIWIIKNIYKTEWDRVEKWELIAELDDTYLNINIEKAKLSLKTAQSNYEIKNRWWTQNEIDIQSKQLEANIISLQSVQSQTEIDLQTALDNKQIAKDNLDNIQKQIELSLLNAQNNIDTSKIDLQIAQDNANYTISQEEEKYTNAQNKLLMEVGQIISIIEKNLFDIDMLLWISDSNKYHNDTFEIYLWAKNSSLKNIAENNYRETKQGFDSFYSDWKIYRQSPDLSKWDEYMNQLKEIWSWVNRTLHSTLDVLKNSITSQSLSQITIDNYISNFEKVLSDSKTSLANFSSFIQTATEIKTSADVKIDASKNQVVSTQQKLKIAEANYQKIFLENDILLSWAQQKLDQANIQIENTKLKNESLLSKENSQVDISKTLLESKSQVDILDLDPFIIAIATTKKNLEEANQKKEDVKLYSPISGKIVDITGRVWDQTNNLKWAFATVINTSTMYVESFVEEWDIMKIKDKQEVYLTFDSIEWLTLTGMVIYINDKANIDSNGIVSYEVKILFEVSDTRVKDSMTTTIQFITKQVKNILIIPVPWVKNINKKPSVMMENGTYKQIITWFTDGKMVEVMSWLKLGDKITY